MIKIIGVRNTTQTAIKEIYSHFCVINIQVENILILINIVGETTNNNTPNIVSLSLVVMNRMKD